MDCPIHSNGSRAVRVNQLEVGLQCVNAEELQCSVCQPTRCTNYMYINTFWFGYFMNHFRLEGNFHCATIQIIHTRKQIQIT